MRVAIVSLTKNGAKTAQKIREQLVNYYQLEKIDLYEKANRESDIKEKVVYDKIGLLIVNIWDKYDLIVEIMAMGIVVRTIAKYIKHKSVDPGIIVIDEKANFVISTLSGHLGGANEWTVNIAKLIDAMPVITTSTDVQGFIAPDVVARKLACKVEDFQDLVKMNAFITEGDVASYYIDANLNWRDVYYKKCQKLGVKVEVVNDWENVKLEGLVVCITDKIIDEYLVRNEIKQKLILRPPTVSMGIGCRRDTPLKYIEEAVKNACLSSNISEKSIGKIASVEIKKDEAGLLEYSKKLNVPIEFYDVEKLKRCVDRYKLEESEFVKKTLGVGNVCESAAIVAGEICKLIQKKTKYNKVTISMVKADWSWSEWGQEI